MSEADQPRRSIWRIGPGLLVAAAFIGPGTVTTATRAGGEFGFALLWSLVFAIVATIALQEMAARLGLVTRKGLAEAIRASFDAPWQRGLAITLVLTAIVLGAAAYQTGNLLGAGMGLSLIVGGEPRTLALVIGAVLALVIFVGRDPKWIYRLLVAAVLLMSVSFLATAGLAHPPLGEVVGGITNFQLPEGSLLTCLALIGTTVVPYNLFLHATAVRDQWPADADVHRGIRWARWDAVLAITLGGIVTMAIVATSAAAFFGQSAAPQSAADMARQLEPLLGSTAKGLFAFGLAAAGLTSGLTAPLAAGYAAAGSLSGESKRVARYTAIAIVVVGAALAYALGRSPQFTIVIAQAANAVLLPLVAAFLIYVVNRSDLMGEHRNRWATNILAFLVLAVTITLSVRTLLLMVQS